MPKQNRLRLLPGTLEMLVLQSLVFGPRHGHGIATTLQRLERSGLITSEWGTSDNKRRARFYTLTRAGRKRLVAETGKWEQIVRAVKGVLRARPEEEQA
jgi:DNA-binding PadR family transcriptional regulator